MAIPSNASRVRGLKGLTTGQASLEHSSGCNPAQMTCPRQGIINSPQMQVAGATYNLPCCGDLKFSRPAKPMPPTAVSSNTPLRQIICTG